MGFGQQLTILLKNRFIGRSEPNLPLPVQRSSFSRYLPRENNLPRNRTFTKPDMHTTGYDHSNDDHDKYEEGLFRTKEEDAPLESKFVFRACDPKLAQSLNEAL